jgi:hypothetical protein
MTTTIRVDDPRLTAKERTLLRQIAHRLDNWQDYQPPAPPYRQHTYSTEQMLPETYRAELDRVFGGCAVDGDIRARPTMTDDALKASEILDRAREEMIEAGIGPEDIPTRWSVTPRCLSRASVRNIEPNNCNRCTMASKSCGGT